MGNPAYGANSKIVTARSEIARFVDAFNGAIVGDEIRLEDMGIGFPSIIIFFSGDTIAYRFGFNVNDTERVFLNSRLYYVEYPDLTPFELYLESSAEVIVVDLDLNEMERPSSESSSEPMIEVEQDLDVVSGFWPYYDADRILTEDDFAFLEIGMSLEEIISVVGRPSGIAGMNFLHPFYTLENGRLTLSFYPLFSASFEYLLVASIEYSDGGRRSVALN